MKQDGAGILLNDFTAQWREVGAKALEAVDRVGKSGWLILGQEVLRFEKLLKNFTQLNHAIGCANGLDAIEIALKCLNLQNGDEVLTTPLSAFATTLAIIRAGGKPVFIDVDESGLIDLQKAEEFFEYHSRVKFMVPVHLFGHSVDLTRLLMLKQKYNLTIVEDCAQALGAKSGEHGVGSIGQAAATSFYPTKNLGCMGDGGAVMTNSDEIAANARIMRDYGQTKKYHHDVLGLNSRLDEVQAAILSDALMPLLSLSIAKRKIIAHRYCSEIKNSRIIIPPAPPGSRSTWHLFPILIQGDRGSFQNYLAEVGIQSGIHYPVLITDQQALHNVKGDFPCARNFANSEVSLPIHPYLTEPQVSQIIERINCWAR